MSAGMNRSVAQVLRRTGLHHGDKYGTTNGWWLDTRNGACVVRYRNSANPEHVAQDIERMATALIDHGYQATITGATIRVTRSAQTQPNSKKDNQ